MTPPVQPVSGPIYASAKIRKRRTRRLDPPSAWEVNAVPALQKLIPDRQSNNRCKCVWEDAYLP
jgi:hypothetical protein